MSRQLGSVNRRWVSLPSVKDYLLPHLPHPGLKQHLCRAFLGPSFPVRSKTPARGFPAT